MDSDLIKTFFVGVSIGASIVVLIFSIYALHGSERVRREAVKAGVARYVADEDGDPKFEWIDPKPWWRLDDESR